MLRPLPLAAQAVSYALFALLLGYFSVNPAYTYIDPDSAVIKLSFNHAGARAGECRQLTPEEIAELAPNMRRPVDCPRKRVPLLVELEMDGVPLYRASVSPSGFADDGPATVYERFVVPPGRHELTARLRDSRRTEGFDYEARAEVELAAQQNFVVDFQAKAGGFIFK
jgi:hypothetical protein